MQTRYFSTAVLAGLLSVAPFTAPAQAAGPAAKTAACSASSWDYDGDKRLEVASRGCLIAEDAAGTTEIAPSQAIDSCKIRTGPSSQDWYTRDCNIAGTYKLTSPSGQLYRGTYTHDLTGTAVIGESFPCEPGQWRLQNYLTVQFTNTLLGSTKTDGYAKARHTYNLNVVPASCN
ncbi:hypothetical protein [Streptomyces sp. ITFR-16]|uniref:hypothetical protein n=1 Tax=Streptomyces sp. ITFR-16 TaxID=3075198 RepID=UPI00288B5169|nr:hypothetical protein [Streptomyces sp. ITFR-16]WNI26731.1 hypothetical protein RLT58_34795 [Streptomyces sp. ITFR-16]